MTARDELIQQLYDKKLSLSQSQLIAVTNFIIADRLRVVEACAQIAEHQKKICGSSLSRQSTALDIAYNIRKAGVSI